jgi:hypothetical protein
MRATTCVLAVAALCVLGPGPGYSQTPRPAEKPRAPVDQEKAILNEIREAYKAPFEVPQDILKELRRAYEQPTEAREAKIFAEIRRMYLPTPRQEESILREIRRAYEQRTPEQEDRVFQEINRAKRLAEGAVPPSVQARQVESLFRRLDVNEDGWLGPDEMPDGLRGALARWDANRDGVLDLKEYEAYYQDHLGRLSQDVIAGKIDLRLKRGGPRPSPPTPPPPAPELSRPVVYRYGRLPAGLPDWFAHLDTDKDGQVGLYEWLRGGRPRAEFLKMDINRDGFLTAEELLRHLRAGGSPPDPRAGPSLTWNGPPRGPNPKGR